MSQLTNNTTTIESLINTINTLPDIDSGSGGTSIETCSVTVINKRFKMPIFIYTTYKDNTIQTIVISDIVSGSTTNIECIKGTKVIVSEAEYSYSSGMMLTEITGGITFDEYIECNAAVGTGVYTITGNGTLTLTDDG